MRIRATASRSGSREVVTATAVTAKERTARNRSADEIWSKTSPLHAPAPIRPTRGAPGPPQARTRQGARTPADYLKAAYSLCLSCERHTSAWPVVARSSSQTQGLVFRHHKAALIASGDKPTGHSPTLFLLILSAPQNFVTAGTV